MLRDGKSGGGVRREGKREMVWAGSRKKREGRKRGKREGGERKRENSFITDWNSKKLHGGFIYQVSVQLHSIKKKKC